MARDLALVLKARDEASRVLAGLDKSLGGMGATVEKSGGKIGGFVDTLGKIGLAGLGIKAAVQGVTMFTQQLIGDAVAAQQVAVATDAVVASTKGVAGMSAAAIADLASSLSTVIPIEDEVIQGAENMLLTFTNIGKGVFPEATEATLNMATALGQDAQQAAMMLGKALNDPIAGVGALRRVGVQLTDQQEAMIKSFMAVGDIASAQKIILGELATEFGGAARAAGTTFAGKLAILQTQIGNVKEAIGNALLPVLTTLLDKAMPLVVAFGERLPAAFAAVGTAVGPVISLLRSVGAYFGSVAEDGDYLNDFLADLPGPIRGIVQPIGQAVALLRDLGRYFGFVVEEGDYLNDFLTDLPGPMRGVAQVVGQVLSVLRLVPILIGDIVSEGGDLGVFADDLRETFGINIGPFVDFMRQATDVVRTLATGDMSGFVASLRTLTGLNFGPLVAAIGGVVDAWKGLLTTGDIGAFIRNLAGADAQLITALAGLGQTILTWIGSQLPAIWAQMQTWGAALWGWIEPMIPPVLAKLGELAAGLWAWIQAQAAPLLEKFGAWAEAFVAWIVPATIKFLAEWPSMLNKFLDWIGEQAVPILSQLGEWALAFIKWIAPMIPPFLLALAGVVASLVVFLAETAVTIGLKLLQWALAFVSWVAPLIPPLLVELAKLLLQLTGWIFGTALPAIIGKLVEWAAAFVNWVAPQVPLLIAELGKLLISLTTWLSDTALPGIVKGFGDIWAGVKSGATTAWDSIKGIIIGAINSIIDSINSLIGSWNSLGATIPGFNVELPSVTIPLPGGGSQRIGGGNLSWPGVSISSPDLPVIPHLAAGTDWWKGGMAMVGERGPELVNLPRGSSVLSAGASRDASIDYAALGEAVAAAIERRARADVTGIMTAMWQGDVLAALRAVVLNTEGQSSDYGLARSLAGA